MFNFPDNEVLSAISRSQVIPKISDNFMKRIVA